MSQVATSESCWASLDKMAMGRLLGAHSLGAEHNQQFNKILDLNYEADRKMVSLTQALGVREVTSQSGQLGIPNAVTGKPA